MLQSLAQGLTRRVRDMVARVMSSVLPRGLMADPRYAELWERKGLHITPVGLYSPIPSLHDLRELDTEQHSAMVGIDLNLEGQLRFLQEAAQEYASECTFPTEPSSAPYAFHLNSGFFESFDAEILYCMIRARKPRLIIEIGSGYTTYLSAQASLANLQREGHQTSLCAIEPFPNNTLKEGVPGLSRLIQQPVQKVDLSRFQQLRENDILFIDSTHSVRTGSDVLTEYLEILPRLRRGVLVHIHDVFLPRDYPTKWMKSLRWFPTEQYLLQAFLCFNKAFEVTWASSAMALRHADRLAKAFPQWQDSYVRMPARFKAHICSLDGRNVWPSSFWIRKVE